MKKKLSEYRKEVEGFKSVWLDARKAKKAEADIKSALTAYQESLAVLDNAIADGKTDNDEIEIKALDQVIELGEIGQTVAAQVKAVMDAKLGELSKTQLTEDGVKKIVSEAIKASKKSELEMSDADVRKLVEEVTGKAMKGIKLPSKFRGNADDAHRGGAGDTDTEGAEFSEDERKSFGMITMPNSLTKGNLPLHMKQLLNCLLRKPQDQDVPETMLKRGKALDDDMFTRMQIQGVKALTTTGTGTGAEWIPRMLSAELYRRLYLKSQVAQVMLAREIQMPTNPYDLPFSTTRPKFFKNGVQNIESKSSTPGSAKPTLTAQKLVALVQYSYEANEDSIIPILPLIETLLGEAAAAALETALINGDDSATHQDADITDPNDVQTIWKGFRKLALAAGLKKDLSTGGITRANILSLKKAMGKWGVSPGDLMFICSPQTSNDFLGLDDVVTVYAHGQDATHITGVLPSYYGTPITISEQAREDLNASGVNDGITTTKGGILLVNWAQFVTGVRREFTIEVDRNIKSQTNDIVASFRKAFTPTDAPSSTVKTVAYGYNFNV